MTMESTTQYRINKHYIELLGGMHEARLGVEVEQSPSPDENAILLRIRHSEDVQIETRVVPITTDSAFDLLYDLAVLLDVQLILPEGNKDK